MDRVVLTYFIRKALVQSFILISIFNGNTYIYYFTLIYINPMTKFKNYFE